MKNKNELIEDFYLVDKTVTELNSRAVNLVSRLPGVENFKMDVETDDEGFCRISLAAQVDGCSVRAEGFEHGAIQAFSLARAVFYSKVKKTALLVSKEKNPFDSFEEKRQEDK